MITVTKTDTRGFRAERFRNQVVHQYYGHLQSVMHSIEPSDLYKNLFARPEVDGFSSENTNVEWTSSLSGRPVHYSQLSELDRQRVDRFIEEAFARINKYVAEAKDKSGKERDYSQFLSIVGKKPNTNQIWIVGGKPTIVQWGYNDENNLMGSSGIYPNWDAFIGEIQTIKPEEKTVSVASVVEAQPMEQETPVIEPVQVVVAPSTLFVETPEEVQKQEPVKEVKVVKKADKTVSKPVAKAKKPVKKEEEKEKVMAGLGGYWWVKWLAIILLIIIIILLLLRLFPQAQAPLGQMPGVAGGPVVINGGAGGQGSGNNGIGGGAGSPEGGNGGIGGGTGAPEGGDSGMGGGAGAPEGGNGGIGGGAGAPENDNSGIGGGAGKPEDNANDSPKGSDNGKPENGANGGPKDGNHGNDGVTGNNDSDENPAGGDISKNSSDADNNDSLDKVNPEDLCPICRKSFTMHSPEDLKKCLLNAQEGKEEMRKKLQKFVNEFDETAEENVGD